MMNNHFTTDLLARERINDLQREASEARLARNGRKSTTRRPHRLGTVRHLVGRLAYAVTSTWR
jgi:hypothetical protein